MVHRIASSKHYSSGLHEIETQWSIDDLYDAHDVLDMLQDLEARANEPVE